MEEEKWKRSIRQGIVPEARSATQTSWSKSGSAAAALKNIAEVTNNSATMATMVARDY